MYLEQQNQLNMDQDVNEATAALKGLLGIGATTAIVENPSSQLKNHHQRQQQHDESNPTQSVSPPNSDGGDNNKANQNNKNKKKNKKKKGGTAVNKQQNRATTPPKADYSNNNNSNPANINNNNKATSTKKKKSNHKNKKESENFAWSAFQSSPDASKLPIPAFSSSPSTIEKRSVNAITGLTETTNSEDATAAGADTTYTGPAPSAEQNVSISTDQTVTPGDEATQGKNLEVKQEDLPTVEAESTSTKVAGDESAVNTSSATATTASADPSDATAETPAASEAAPSTTTEAPVSSTGVNLAALAAKPPSKSDSTPGTHAPPTLHPQSIPPGTVLQQHQNQQVPRFNNAAPPQMGPPYGGGGQQQQHNYPNQHPLQHRGQFPPPPPPGYMTIQVQVPHGLMPGRHMVVTSPAGYPVQVAVPAGIPPGMIIPVHVPAGPPMHMMPPPPHYGGGGQYYNHPPNAHGHR